MSLGDTIRRLSEMTDEAAFEQLATAILREAKPQYAGLIHTGVNVEGKTVKAPVDGITFVAGAEPPHLIAAHHTICTRKDLRAKWLHDPATVKPRKLGKPTAPAGDVLKTAEITTAERKRTPSLRVTLALTTNREPPEDLVRDVIASGSEHGIDIDIWSATLLAHYLDNTDQGQWLRYKHLGLEQERLSRNLLAQLSRKSLKINTPQDRRDTWVSRSLDRSIAETSDKGVLFVIAGSGMGKSVACYKHLSQHVDAGGYGLVIPHEVIASAHTLDDAVDATLRRLHPHLVPDVGLSAQQYGSAETPLLLIVEDINKSGQAPHLAEKLAKWAGSSRSGDAATAQSCRLLCPVWPQVVSSLGDETRKHIHQLAVVGEAFSPSEGREAVKRRGIAIGRTLSNLDADAISDALGHDPLLVALHDPAATPQPALVIKGYVDASLARLAVTRGDYTAIDYRTALRALANSMLTRRQITPRWSDISEWLGGQSDIITMLRHLVHHTEVIRLTEDMSDVRLLFRHDRVRDHVLADAVAEAIKQGELDNRLLADPYFAEVIGTAILGNGIPLAFVDRVRATNALALFYSLRMFREPTTELHQAILTSIDAWLADFDTHTSKNTHLRWHALAALSETESTKVIQLVTKFNMHAWTAWQALFRNGELNGGLNLCLDAEPGVGAPWRDRQIEHAKNRFGTNLRLAIDKLLRQTDSEPPVRVGALRLAGYLADPQLAEAIEVSWIADPSAVAHLKDYLWAAARCCGNNPDRFLEPICDAWAALSDERTDKSFPSPREDFAAHEIRWAFHKDIPVSAVPYFIKRAQSDDLRWPITYMLHGLDHPDAVEFVVQELAEMERRIEGKNSFSPFANMAPDEWRRRQEEGRRPMSQESRDRLLAFWQNQSSDKHLREQSFRLWAATEIDGDLEILRSVDSSDLLTDNALWKRVARGDRTAVPRLLDKLRGDRPAPWWRLAGLVWSEPVSLALHQALERRRALPEAQWRALPDLDHALAELITDLPPFDGEPFLVKHWDHLQFSPLFVQPALFLATPRLLSLAKPAIESAPEPRKMFKHIRMHWGISVQGRQGITRRDQLDALVPYLDYLDEITILTFWEVCNKHRWFDFRRKHFDGRLTGRFERIYSDEARSMASLDQFLEKQNVHWIDRWIEDYLKTGATIDQIMSLIGRWLSERRSIEALRVAAEALIQSGRRSDICLLDIVIEPRETAASLRANTEFAVRRRTLH